MVQFLRTKFGVSFIYAIIAIAIVAAAAAPNCMKEVEKQQITATANASETRQIGDNSNAVGKTETIKAEIIGKATIETHNAQLYQGIARKEIHEGNTVYSPGFPIGKSIATLTKGDSVDILAVIRNYSESRYTLKVKTKTNKYGYITSNNLTIAETYGDKGAIIGVHLSMPYEYEGNISRIDADIKKYQQFINKYPNSQFVSEALVQIAFLNIYPLQIIRDNAGLERIEKVKKICNRFSLQNGNAHLSQAGQQCDAFLSNMQSTNGSYSKYYRSLYGLIDAIDKLVPHSLELE